MSQSGYQPAVGQRFQPRDRETFFDAQRRNRHATWRMSALCVLAAIAMGIPLALIVTPLLYGGGLIAADIVNLFWPIPPAFWQQANEVARFGLVALNWLLQHTAARSASAGVRRDGHAFAGHAGVYISVDGNRRHVPAWWRRGRAAGAQGA